MESAIENRPNKIQSAKQDLLANTPLRSFGPVIENWFFQDMKRLYCELQADNVNFFSELLTRLSIAPEYTQEEIRRIPSNGPLIVVANHPFGLVEGIILGAILSKVRSDVKFLANSVLRTIPQLENLIFPIDLSGTSEAIKINRKSVRAGIRWLQAGGLLVVFPAGEVASIQFPNFGITEPGWTDSVSRLVRRTKAPVLPIFFHGVNGPIFHIAGLIHPKLRTLFLPRELLNKRGRTIRITIGSLIDSRRLNSAGDPRSATEYLRARTFLLSTRTAPQTSTSRFFRQKQASIVKNRPSNLLRAEVESLPAKQRLITHNEFVVYEARSEQIPQTLAEIGGLRELTFRRVGEGTGKSVDLDRFDQHYSHLFLWNQEKCEIVGAYRFAKVDEIVTQQGLRGLYTSTLFHLSSDFYSAIQPALELGRSFVRPEYQKSYLPLLMLWKGLGQYVAARPQYRILFGPVSISNDYSPASRALMVSYLRSRCRNEVLAGYVEPRHKFRVRAAADCDPRNFSTLLADIDEVSEVVADLEPDRKGVPILLQHYLNLGGQILDFNIDPKFSNAVDGLIIVDLAKASRRLLERYMGKIGAEHFLRHYSAH